MRSRTLLGLVAFALMSLMVASASACPGLSPGYWKHNVKVYNGGPGHYSLPGNVPPEWDPSHETDESMLGYADHILDDHTGYFSGLGITTAHQVLVWANSKFQNNAYKDMWLTIANWFNHAAGYEPYSS